MLILVRRNASRFANPPYHTVLIVLDRKTPKFPIESSLFRIDLRLFGVTNTENRLEILATRHT